MYSHLNLLLSLPKSRMRSHCPSETHPLVGLSCVHQRMTVSMAAKTSGSRVRNQQQMGCRS
ncbi:hypothetical protein SCLCIDRAFT_943514 [Scleroderma citrinum Foug A]|uniref:Uncharacterized protein n=1 Tax=Scleroderma citrinum Foug A TaxID=1036808 RepID=A0A0C3DIG6_9AGAM|nr:hypothetical protein SCLCIDRAFT_943514 [Scleroderma citrinum Foug A]